MEKENHFSSKMINKTDSELKHLVDNKSQFQEGAVLAAIWELEKRDLKSNDIMKAESEIKASQLTEKESRKNIDKDSNLTDNPNAPILYVSKQVRYFGVFFSVFAGSILMAINFSKLGDRKTASLVLISGIFYSILQVYVLNLIESNTYILTFPACLLGMYLLETIFWDNEKTKNLKFRKRGIWPPILVALLITVPIMIFLLIALINGY